MWANLISWSKKEFSDLPWRRKRSVYGTLVSEIMLQQTTVSTVINHFERFITKYPTLSAIARMSDEEMLLAWKGLGYYRRAKNLKKIAEIIVSDYEDEIPCDLDLLLKINGIGPYTANAIVGIGYDKPALAVDANLERVLARIYGIETPKGPRLQKQILQLFLEKKIIPQRHLSFRELNEALMDLGRTICQSKKAACEICPLKKECQAFKTNKVKQIPVISEEASKKVSHELKLLRIVVKTSEGVMAYKKGQGQWLEGQWEIPTFVISCDDKNFKQYPKAKDEIDFNKLPFIKTGITKYSIENYILTLSVKQWKSFAINGEYEWLKGEEINHLSTSSLKCLEKIK
ncbi:MAG: hypothetical protein K2P81_06560 [Bacteriovoracaceae bacterium]|nr:hypothetical protein [Bacteriovoracaceae bacterium]